jgi:IS5 family transposase
MNNDGHLGRCWLEGREGDAANAIVDAVGYNFRLALAWLMSFLRLILPALSRRSPPHHRSNRLVNQRRLLSGR